MTRLEQLRSLTNQVKATTPKVFTGGIVIYQGEFARFTQIYEQLNHAGDFEKFLYQYILTLEKRIEELENGR